MPITLRQRYMLLGVFVASTILLSGFYLRNNLRSLTSLVSSKRIEPGPKHPKYKAYKLPKNHPIVDNFPLALNAHSASDLPTIPKWNQPPNPHVPEKTPLLIGFTRNWRLLQQVVVSYITAGWPPEDIYVVENTGVMNSNKDGEISLQNPFFLNHTRLNMLGVNILITPTLLTFAQVQNYFLWTAIENKWPAYFWSHMDIVVLSYEDRWLDAHPDDLNPSPTNFQSLYDHCISALRNVTAPNPETGVVKPWALEFFSYDRLALVNTDSYQKVGGWDTLIPFYGTDCDMHERLAMEGFEMGDWAAGAIWDVASSLDDLEVLYRKKDGPDPSFIDPNIVEEEPAQQTKKSLNPTSNSRNSKHQSRDLGLTKLFSDNNKKQWIDEPIGQASWKKLLEVLDHMGWSKTANKNGRNTWQGRQTGGHDDPYYRDSEGFERGIQLWIDYGRRVFAEKWGHRDCDLRAQGLVALDAWRVERDW
ncbi:46150536-4742-477b-9dfa-0494c8f8d43e [Sclerotinia trifoliorum]|uniref:46150536-4742-477b-9dfa-0494c8f8d43e n=1 Tax=Sclerotinia trifoliorum TaxID=28548 RepID=A0A8H2VNX3_9HELO|nr:46150536-4742-477b-9dfa-0494c8f8d43e [Sclerotinia trifoliorum]